MVHRVRNVHFQEDQPFLVHFLEKEICAIRKQEPSAAVLGEFFSLFGKTSYQEADKTISSRQNKCLRGLRILGEFRLHSTNFSRDSIQINIELYTRNIYSI
eukprot:Gregarina_sp_Poly_1__4685@NODE_2502_length_2052_cov_853_949118_g1589_i0_p2_GENE_NODE_2502_length_2052_cov_853_949118_g1589_i0NODE_2502_length_2052_cov_853_949118_g1589_i0_p2_ORF_typecomplete_len101_score9_99Clathrin_H_link/PF13838_6/0_21_NODE_2502_length_2052_cov_853_949118_g1589_i07501052